MEQAEAEVVPSSSLVEVQVEVEVGVEAEVGVEFEVGVGVVSIGVQLFSKLQMYCRFNLDAVTTYTGG